MMGSSRLRIATDTRDYTRDYTRDCRARLPPEGRRYLGSNA